MKLVLRLTILAILLAVASPAQAVTYNRYEDVVRNTSGRSVAGAAIYVYAADTDSLVTLYTNKTGTTAAGNPVYSDVAGRYYFYVEGGLYDLAVTRSGIGYHLSEDVAIGLISGGDLAMTGTVAFEDSISVAKGVSGHLFVGGNFISGGTIVSAGNLFSGGTITSTSTLSVLGSQISMQNYVAIIRGTGSPEGAVTANVGAIYMRSDGGTGSTFYVKESGSGNTGWVAK